MASDRVSKVLTSFENDTNGISELCRTCLCKADDDYVSIESVCSWSKGESCSAQKMIEQIINRELSKMQPQPQRICSKCIRKIRTISVFRNQCIETENKLNEFQKNSVIPEIELMHIKTEYTLDDEDPELPDQNEETFYPLSELDLFKNDAEIRLGPQSPLLATTPPPEQPQISVAVDIPKPKRKSKKPIADVDKYVNKVIQEDISASLKNLEKKFKKDKIEDDFTGLCEHCGLSFTNGSEYRKHVRTHDDKANQKFKFTCKFCLKGFNHKQTYNIHLNSHTREIKFICDMCGKELATKNSLRIHFRYHLGIKNHICQKCGHRFVTPRELRDHVEKRHDAVRAIACTYSDCSETFDSEYRLNLHLRVHETNYAFVCDICGAATVSKFRLRVHKKIHTGEMKRKCPICDKSLAHDNALRRHIRNVHNDKQKSPTGPVAKLNQTSNLNSTLLALTN